MKIYAGHYFKFELRSDAPPAFTHELARRMSPLQRSYLSAMAQFETQSPEAFVYAFKECEAPTYFASSNGELDALVKVAQGISNPQIPLSPTAFQNSVHNAAPAYFSILKRLHNPHLAISSGFTSSDRTLFLAYQHLLSQQEDCICVAIANEAYPELDTRQAHCELFLLFNDNHSKSLQPTLALQSMIYSGRRPMPKDGGVQDLQPEEAPGSAEQATFSKLFEEQPHMLNATMHRTTSSFEGETFSSTWGRFNHA